MHLLKHNKPAKPAPLVPIISHWKVPFHRRLRGKRYNAQGEFIGETGPQRFTDSSLKKLVTAAHAAAAALPPPVEGGGFDLATFTPLAGRILLKRPPQITEDNGIALPENKWKSEPWFFVVKVGPRVSNCGPGDRVIFSRGHKPKQVRFGHTFYLGRASAVAGRVEVSAAS